MAETSDKRTTGHLAAVHIVTEEEAATGAFAINDVVLPLPGSCIMYPEHSTAQVCLSTRLLLRKLCLAPLQGCCMLDDLVLQSAAPVTAKLTLILHPLMLFLHRSCIFHTMRWAGIAASSACSNHLSSFRHHA